MAADNKRRTVLIIEDNELNREMLCAFLADDYDVIEAENGKVGMELLSEYKNKISLILLDIQMPVMNGYEFLDAVKLKPRFANIPIIVATSSANALDEINCLENGASDFVAKPYNPEIVLRRVSSMIRLSEASNLINKVEYDDVTELYIKEFFFFHTENLLANEPDSSFDMVCFNVNSVKMLSDRYEEKASNRMFEKVASCIKGIPYSISGRINANQFAVLLPHSDNEFYNKLLAEIDKAVLCSPIPDAVVQAGVYYDVNHSIPVASIYNNAELAVLGIRYQFNKRIAVYDESLKNKFIREQEIAYSFESGLSERQFKVYYQPKYDLVENKVGGAEALIRWFHPQMGFLSPGEFIPLFEKNGSITALDYYIVEQVCMDLRGWLDEGMSIVPVSINFSRADFEDKALVDKFKVIVEKYAIPCELIHVEVTESAYAETPERIHEGIKKLREMGFKIELDDFGSGYSSLQVLDEMSLDVLKLDMSLVRNSLTKRRRDVLQCIFELAKKLNMSVVAEGIETYEQVCNFRELGCRYAQGYYYSKPIPKDGFEKYLKADLKGE